MVLEAKNLTQTPRFWKNFGGIAMVFFSPYFHVRGNLNQRIDRIFREKFYRAIRSSSFSGQAPHTLRGKNTLALYFLLRKSDTCNQ